MRLVGVTGKGSVITQNLLAKYYGSADDIVSRRNPVDIPVGCDEVYIVSGLLVGKTAREHSSQEIVDTFNVNFADIVKFCDEYFSGNAKAKVCIISSMSGRQGSYDMIYAGAKAAIDMYVRTKRLTEPEQHLVAVAPWIISDAGMTMRRKDLGQILERGKRRRMGRWASAREIADIAHFAMQTPLLCNTVIEAKGGIC